MRDFKGPLPAVVFPFGTALGIAIAAGINYRPDRTCLPSLIVHGVVNLVFDLSRSRSSRFPAGRMTRRYRQNYWSATESCRGASTKINPLSRRRLTVASDDFAEIGVALLSWHSSSIGSRVEGSFFFCKRIPLGIQILLREYHYVERSPLSANLGRICTFARKA